MQIETNHQEDLYLKMKALEEELEFLELQENFIKSEQQSLKRESIRAREELKKIQSVPLQIGSFVEMVDENYGLVQSGHGSLYMVRVLSILDRELLKPNQSVALQKTSQAVVDILPTEADVNVQMLKVSGGTSVRFSDIGGLDVQKQEIKEAIELPLKHPELFEKLGIDAPRGVLMYGPPGTGKTMMAKAVAGETDACFISVVGSEFVQKYLGEGPKMVRDVFKMARENAPSIIFIDEVDSIATKRFDAQTGADREVQRILIELLTQMDGFDKNTNVKIIMATNREDTIDPALLRPGRLDRKIEFPLPDKRQKRLIFQAVTSKMSLGHDVELENLVGRSEKVSSADISAICQEAGMQAVRKNRYVVMQTDFDKAYEIVLSRAKKELQFYSL